MMTIGNLTLLLLGIVAACQADLPDSPSSTPAPDSQTPTLAGLLSTPYQQQLTTDGTSTLVGAASALAGPTDTSDQKTSEPNQQTATPSGRTSRPFQPTPTSDKQIPTLTEQTAKSTRQTAKPIRLRRRSTWGTEQSPTSFNRRSTCSDQTSTSEGQTATSSSPAPVLCGPVPRNIHRCIGGPKLVKPEWGLACSKHTDECEIMKCVYENAGWIKNGEIDKKRISDHFSQFAKLQPQWLDAVNQAMESCIRDALKPQGVYLNCPAYDITSCIETAFVRNTTPSQWSTSTDCQHTRRMASACPFCPEDCFAPQVPYGSCNACLGLALQRPSSSTSPSN